MDREKVLKEAGKLRKFFWVQEVDNGRFRVFHYTGNPPGTCRRAMLLSIAKWMVLKDTENPRRIHSGLGWSSCGLCLKFYNGIDCGNCPINFSTGYPGCDKTPFEDFMRAKDGGQKDAEKEFEFLVDLACEGLA